MSSSKPNILWIQTDEQRADSLGCYGSSWARTPVLDELAAQGVVFTQAFCQSPQCVPSRTSQLTGMYPQECNTVFNTVEGLDDILPPHTVTFPQILAQAGYHTVTLGKSHTPAHPIWLEEHDLWYVREHASPTSLGDAHNDADWNVIHRQGGTPIIQAGTYPGGHDNQSRIITDQAIDWLGARRDKGTPFLLRVSHNWPHTPVLPPKPFDRCYDPDELPIKWFDQTAYEARSAHDRTIADEQRGADLSADEVRQIWKDYMGLCAYVDWEIGRLLTTLRATGKADRTIVLFTADHGKSLGEWGAWEKGTFDDPAWRVPMIWSWPGHLPCGEYRHDLCELIDTGRTLLNLVNESDRIPPHWRGRDLFHDPAPQAVFGQIGWPSTNGAIATNPTVAPRMTRLGQIRRSMRVAMRTDAHHLDLSWMRNGRTIPREQQDSNLFDLRADPDQQHNLWREPAAEPLVNDLTQQLQQWLDRIDRPAQLFGEPDAVMR